MRTRTTTALLNDLMDPAKERVWSEFDDRYRPILFGFARRLGLEAEDAADAAQEALARFVRSFRAGEYDRARGRLSSWLVGIARHCVADAARQRATQRVVAGASAIAEIVAREDELESIWQAERQREILRRAMASLADSRMDERTISAFELVALHDAPAEQVGRQLNMTTDEVYVAKHRCLKRLRTIIQSLTAAYEAEG